MSARVVQELRLGLAELLGTFALTFVAVVGIMVAAVTNDQVSYVARVSAPGLLVMAMIYTLGGISGAHLNPAVTLAFALRSAFPWSRVPIYWAAQVIGALLAAAVARLLIGDVKDLGATLPHFGTLPAFGMEIVLTWLLVVVIIGTATGTKLVGQNAGIAVGGTIALCGLIADPASGASMNPARSLGPLLLAGKMDVAWIYIAGPVCGSLLAVATAWLIHGPPDQEEVDAASGEAAQDQQPGRRR